MALLQTRAGDFVSIPLAPATRSIPARYVAADKLDLAPTRAGESPNYGAALNVPLIRRFQGEQPAKAFAG